MSQDPTRAREQAWEALAAGRLERATELWMQILRADGSDWEAYGALGSAERLAGRLPNATTLLGRAAEMAGESHGKAWALSELALALKAEGKIDESLQRALQCAQALDREAASAPAAGAWAPGSQRGPQAVRWAFCEALRDVSFGQGFPGLAEPLAQALESPWTRPSLLAMPALSLALRAIPLLRAARRCEDAWPARPRGPELWRDGGLAALDSQELFLALLRSTPIPDLRCARMLSLLRSALLDEAAPRAERRAQAPPPPRANPGAPDAPAAGPPAPAPGLALACAMARQSFLAEYVWDVTPVDHFAWEALRGRVVSQAERGAFPSEMELAVLACFEPLGGLRGSATTGQNPLEPLMADASRWGPDIRGVWSRQALRPARERALAADASAGAAIPRLTPVEDEVSQLVGRQYEQNPYPRWEGTWIPACPLPMPEWAAASFPSARHRFPPARRQGPSWRALVAGCGTGRHTAELAMRHPDARVMGIDLSRASLAYARRCADGMGLSNLDLAQADILLLPEALAGAEPFDWIESVGTLHHMAEPLEGWRALMGLLAPGGGFKAGLYSRRARQLVARGRAWAEARGFERTPEGIRQLRQELPLAHRGALAPLSRLADFHTGSELRDLLMHEQESDVDFLELRDWIHELGADLLGVDAPARIMAQFLAERPDPGAALDLAQWDQFEQAHPDAFIGMIQLHVQKRG